MASEHQLLPTEQTEGVSLRQLLTQPELTETSIADALNSALLRARQLKREMQRPEGSDQMRCCSSLVDLWMVPAVQAATTLRSAYRDQVHRALS